MQDPVRPARPCSLMQASLRLQATHRLSDSYCQSVPGRQLSTPSISTSSLQGPDVFSFPLRSHHRVLTGLISCACRATEETRCSRSRARPKARRRVLATPTLKACRQTGVRGGDPSPMVRWCHRHVVSIWGHLRRRRHIYLHDFTSVQVSDPNARSGRFPPSPNADL